ncbi:MAG: FGGY family carbohydrate kinase [Pseudomonadota bacterium]
MQDLILSIDLGTTAVKVALFGKSGDLVALSTQEYSLLTPEATVVEASVDTYWESFKKGILALKTKCAFSAESIKALGISAQGETLFFLDQHGTPLRNAIVWMDNRAQAESEVLTETFTNELCYRITGQVSFDPCWPAAKILWVRNNEPEVFGRTDKFSLIEDYFIYRLTGKFVSEGSLLCSTAYWNITTKRWWEEMLLFLGISEDRLPQICEPGDPIGPILPAVAVELGLSPSTIVCTGALDQAAGAIGVGNIAEGIFSENIGAALAICSLVRKPPFHESRIMPIHYFGIPDMYMMHSFTTGGMVLRWFRDAFCEMEKSVSGLIGDDSYNLLGREASLVAPGCEGLIMLPHLNGSMAPDVNPKAKGVFYGFTLKHQKPHFIRAIMEALGYIVRRNIEALDNIGIAVGEIRSLGGGARSATWNQIKADITGRPLVTMYCAEAASLGAAILAGKAVGMYGDITTACEQMVRVEARFEPNPTVRELYDKSYDNYKQLFNDLTELFRKS